MQTKNVFFAEISCFFQLFYSKNAENDYFDQCLGAYLSSKYTFSETKLKSDIMSGKVQNKGDRKFKEIRRELNRKQQAKKGENVVHEQ